MLMRFAPSRRGAGEIRFSFARVNSGEPNERVRLLSYAVRVWESPDVQEQWELIAQGVMLNVARPRRRVGTEATMTAIREYLTNATGEEWDCLNPYRCTRRRRIRRRVTLTGEVGTRRHHIHSYSHKPAPRFRVGGGEGSDVRTFFGVELEIDTPRGACLDRHAVPDLAAPMFYCKEDGSLSNGVELVSHPGSMKWWTEQRGNVEALLSRLSRLGWRSHEVGTCGMHIHISAAAFQGSMHIYRFLHLIYRFPALALVVSQRSQYKLNQWATLSYNRKPMLKRKADMRLKGLEFVGSSSAGHYDGVNKTDHTFELRIFNGTLNPSRFYKNLQYAHAALMFTADTLNLRHVNAARFVSWIHEHSEQYPDLAAFLADHRSSAALRETRASKARGEGSDAA